MYRVVSVIGKCSNHSVVMIVNRHGNAIKTWRLKNISERKLKEIVDAIETVIDYTISRDASLEVMLEMASLRVRMI